LALFTHRRFPLFAFAGHWPLTTGHCSPVPRRDQRGSGRAQSLPRWLPPSTDLRIDKDRTGPDLDDRPLSIQYVTESGDPFGQIKLFLATPRCTTVDRSLVWLGALNTSDTRHACRMASGCNARAPCLESLRLFSIVPQVEPLAPNLSLLTPRLSMVGRPLSTDVG
jgi:hypothetical protein